MDSIVLTWKQKNVKKVGDYHDLQQGPAASHFAWNAQTQTMYALNSVQSGNGLVKIDLTNGDLIPVCTFSYDRLTEKTNSGTRVYTP